MGEVLNNDHPISWVNRPWKTRFAERSIIQNTQILWGFDQLWIVADGDGLVNLTQFHTQRSNHHFWNRKNIQYQKSIHKFCTTKMIHHAPFQVEAPKCLSEVKTFPDFFMVSVACFACRALVLHRPIPKSSPQKHVVFLTGGNGKFMCTVYSKCTLYIHHNLSVNVYIYICIKSVINNKYTY